MVPFFWKSDQFPSNLFEISKRVEVNGTKKTQEKIAHFFLEKVPRSPAKITRLFAENMQLLLLNSELQQKQIVCCIITKRCY